MVTNNKEEEINYNKFHSKEDDVDYAKRNELFLNFFKRIVFPEKDVLLVGNEKNPAIIIDNKEIISCFITRTNFLINFMDKNRDANRIFSIKLTEPLKKENYDINKILDWYKKYPHRKVYRLYLETKNESIEPPLLLAGWNYKDTENKIGKYPVFGEHNPKIYLTKEKATEVEKELKDGGYNVIII